MYMLTTLLMACYSLFFPAAIPAIKVLRVGESTSFTVKASKLYNNPGLKLVKGAKYEITAKGKWKDGSCKETTADGFLSDQCGVFGSDVVLGSSEMLRRAGSQRWFCLMGEIFDESCNVFDNITADQQFRIGDSRTFTPSVTGKLILFANDVMTMYFNNEGQLTVTVKRIN